MEKKIIIFPIIFILIFAYAYFLELFFANQLWWIFLVFVYIVFFVAYDSSAKRKEIKERLRIKDRKDIRINFWKCF